MAEGELKKMTIEAYRDPERKELIDRFPVLFNPSQYSTKFEIEYANNQGQGTSGASQPFGQIKPQDYSFELVFDGTGAATPGKVDVHKQVTHFLAITGKLDGDLHRPPYLKLIWGPLQLQVILKSADITYTLFQPDGYPLRAKVVAAFSEALPDALREARDNMQSPDLTHERLVRAGDSLPLMTHRVYRTPLLAVRVAQANGLDLLRRLDAGSVLRLPPLVKSKTRSRARPPAPGRG